MASHSLPLGYILLRRCCFSCDSIDRLTKYKASVLFLTFLAYMSYHLSRRPLSIVKTILNRNCTGLTPTIGANLTDPCWCCWKPFDTDNANSILGLLDSSFLISYAIFMFMSGFIAERCHLRYFLALGMIGSGIFTYLFGIAFYYDIHNIYYFIIIQIICGAFQTTGWPAVVAAVGHWFGPRSSRGLIFGIWNSHTNFGNIFGALIAGAFVEYNWGLSFIVPGLIVASVGFIHFLFLLPYPEEVGLLSLDTDIPEPSRSSRSEADVEADEGVPLIDDDSPVTYSYERGAVSFGSALKIPGVLEFSLSLFFCKLVSYTFLYWLPKYLDDSTGSSSMVSAFLSTPFDIGGALGAIGAGILADRTGSPALTCILMLLLTIPGLFVYQIFGTLGYWYNVLLQSLLGLLVNGPYALITTAVAADLGNKVTDTKALATVTAIIDGTGSIGAAVGPFIAGIVSQYGWDHVFHTMMVSDVISLLFLARIGYYEYKKLMYRDLSR
ncbi:major facilitator superfamily transporter 16 isoform X2 [Brevipalpus obovatus]|uniref:major facilitator superfamily transporter 16 isoform X2 n=1 Tax=Brevipalpus obovatus TaxID=246614 RepID=UPI003D9E1EB4